MSSYLKFIISILMMCEDLKWRYLGEVSREHAKKVQFKESVCIMYILRIESISIWIQCIQNGVGKFQLGIDIFERKRTKQMQ